MKQDALAVALGTNQQAIFMMENSETIDEQKLKDVARALGVSVEAIKNFSEENVINCLNTFNEAVSANNFNHYNGCSFNPLDKLVEAYEENRKLYERLIGEIKVGI